MNDYRTFYNYVYTKPLFGAPGEISITSIANAMGISGIHTYGIYMAND